MRRAREQGSGKTLGCTQRMGGTELPECSDTVPCKTCNCGASDTISFSIRSHIDGAALAAVAHAHGAVREHLGADGASSGLLLFPGPSVHSSPCCSGQSKGQCFLYLLDFIKEEFLSGQA